MSRELEQALSAAADRIAPFGRRVVHLEVTGSTNDEAARLAAHGAEAGTLVVADAQTAGRGRLGRSWFSPPGAGLYASIVMRLPWAPPLLTLTGGVALAEGLRGATGLAVELKWPNDLMAPGGGRKLGGILTEGSSEGGVLAFVVFGFGINLRGPFDMAQARPFAAAQGKSFDTDLRDRATSLEAELGRPVDRSVVLVECLAALAARVRDLAEGRAADIRVRWQAFAPSARGRAVEWTADAGRRRGVAEGIDDSGALLVRVGPTVERIVSGEVRWL